MGMSSATGQVPGYRNNRHPVPTLKDARVREVARYTNDKGHTFHDKSMEKVPQAQNK